MSTWTCVTARLADVPDDWSRIAEAFEQFGILGTVQTDDPPTVSAYLPPGATLDPGLVDLLERRGAVEVSQSQVEEEDWANSWKQYFKPVRVGKRLLIKPSWETVEPLEGDLVIELDPGQAFGTGGHPTTRLCLELLESLEIKGARVCDVGCGSGILAIAAAKLGAQRVVCTDSDALAVESAQVNGARNSVELEVTHTEGLPADDNKYDVVLSNLISAAIIQIAPSIANRVAAGGCWIASGILNDNWPEVSEAAEKVGFNMQRVEEESVWVAALLVR